MRSSLQLGQLAGIKIGIHYTWLFAFVLIAWFLATGYFPSIVPGVGRVTHWALGTGRPSCCSRPCSCTS
jgi:hypothetical protein